MVRIPVISAIIGGVLSIPVVLKISGMIQDKIYRDAQNPSDISNAKTCSKQGYYWYENACHAEPKPAYKWVDPIDGTEWDTYKDLCAHYAEAHPGLPCPPRIGDGIQRPIKIPVGV
jgi:hypothetical protein